MCTGGTMTEQELLLHNKNITTRKVPTEICGLKSLVKLDLSGDYVVAETP
ncbi:receptor-like protein kinase, partial [Trifolium medium]|nr:receptor-like protein kinase [Trifolium medium]